VLQPTVDGDEKEEWRWSLPGGKCCHDKLKEGDCCPETAKETTIRVCREETGYLVEIQNLISVQNRSTKTGKEYKRYLFLTEVIGGQPLGEKVFNRETPRWFPLNHMPRNLFLSHREIIQAYIRKIQKQI